MGGHGVVRSAEGELVADVLASDLVGVEGELGHHAEDLLAHGDLEKMFSTFFSFSNLVVNHTKDEK